VLVWGQPLLSCLVISALGLLAVAIIPINVCASVGVFTVVLLCASVGVLPALMPGDQCCWPASCCYNPRDASSHLQSHAAVPRRTRHWLSHWRCCSTSPPTCLYSFHIVTE